MKIFILISLSYSSIAFGGDIPSWIVKGPMSDSSYHYVVCSHDGIDPEEARQIAESKCLASAAKLGGVNVRLTQKTIQSLTGSDSSEVAEIQPLETRIKCEWIDRHLQKIKDGFRVWLRCKVVKESITAPPSKSLIKDDSAGLSVARIEATLILTTVPQADRIIISGFDGERVIEPSTNVLTLDFSTRDTRVTVKKNGYNDLVIELPSFFNKGAKLVRDVILLKN